MHNIITWTNISTDRQTDREIAKHIKGFVFDIHCVTITD